LDIEPDQALDIIRGNSFRHRGHVSGRRADQPSQMGKDSGLGKWSEGVNDGDIKIGRLI